MRILVSGYVCKPGVGSEPGKTWQWCTAMAQGGHDVTLLTKAGQLDPDTIRSWSGALRGTIRVVPVGMPRWAHLMRRLPGGDYAFYFAWQRAARSIALHLHEEAPFEVVHHLAFGADWLPASTLDIKAGIRIWGPVGGATRTPLRLYRDLGVRGALAAILRDVATVLARARYGKQNARRATLTLCQNEDSRKVLSRWTENAIVCPSVAVEVLSVAPGRVDENRIVFAGRLLAWKGALTAIRTLRHLPPSFTLDICGTGPDEGRLRRYVARSDLGARVRFRGRVARSELLQDLAAARALVFPSIHESAGWIVAEAMTLGTPVICLDRGGPPELTRGYGATVAASQAKLPVAIARAVMRMPLGRSPDTRWGEHRLSELVGERGQLFRGHHSASRPYEDGS